MSENKKLWCPMTFNSKTHCECMKQECAWWATYYRGDKNEFSECAVAGISFLLDVANKR